MSRLLSALLRRRARTTETAPAMRHGLDDAEFLRAPPRVYGDAFGEPTYEDGTPLPPEPRSDLRRLRDALPQR